jgi:hypothetical protein
MMDKKVVVRVTIEMLFDAPDATPEWFHSRFVDGTFCCDNIADWLRHWTAFTDQNGGCLCDKTTLEYVREATVEDIADYTLPRDLPMHHEAAGSASV